jgi:hypothetical protein
MPASTTFTEGTPVKITGLLALYDACITGYNAAELLGKEFIYSAEREDRLGCKYVRYEIWNIPVAALEAV